MRKLYLLAAAVILFQSVHAQVKEGKIIYERKVDMHRRMTDESQKAMMPQFNISKVQLFFSGSETIYKNVPEEKDVRDNAGDDGNMVMIHFGGADNETYRNYSNSKSVELRELGPKKYIIEDSLSKQVWKLEEDTKTVCGYTCKKATTKNREGSNVVAWYATAIECSGGPESFGGLPGAILELNINEAEMVFTAMEVNTKDFDKKLVVAPANGKKISEKEFRKMVEDEFGPNPNGGPTIRIYRN
jgi:GLPGLI family protein